VRGRSSVEAGGSWFGSELLAGRPDYVVVEGLPVAAGHDSTIAGAGYSMLAQGSDWRLYRAVDV